MSRGKSHPMARTHLASCRHEAAHAVVMEYFGGRVRWVQAPLIQRVEARGKGATCFGSFRKLGPVQMSCVAMAGSLAEHLWHGTPKGLVSGRDLEDLVASGLKGEDFRIIWEETSRLVRKLKPKIWRLAEQLKSGKRVKR